MVAKFKATSGVPVGGVTRFAEAFPPDFELDGQRFVKNGFAVTSGYDTALLDIKMFDAVNWFKSSLSEIPYTNRGALIQGGVILTGTSGSVVSRSDDNGKNWISIGIPGGAASVECVVGDGASTVLVALGSAGVLTRSENNGLSFTTVTPGTGQQIYDADFDGNGVAILCGSNNALRRSTNNGATFPTGLASGFAGYNNIKIKCGRNGTWLVAGGLNQLSRSTDNGLTWALVPGWSATSSITHFATDGLGNWLAVAGGRLYRSTDDGITWSLVLIPGNYTINAVAYADGLFVASHSTQYSFRSFDKGATWETSVDLSQTTSLTRVLAASPDGATWLLGSSLSNAGTLLAYRGIGINKLTQHDYLRYL